MSASKVSNVTEVNMAHEPSAMPMRSPAHAMPKSHIAPPRGIPLFELYELWKFRELFVFLTWRDIQVRYKQTMIGTAWALLQPIMMMVVFSIFLGRLAKLPTANIPYPLFVFCGLLPWTFFSSAITNAGNSVVGSEKLVTKVYFPRLIIPLASIGASLVDLLVASSILVILAIWYDVSLTFSILLAPLCIGIIAMTAIGTGAMLAALNVAYRDFKFILPFLMQLWFFATPSIFMDIGDISTRNDMGPLSTWLPWLLNLNPMVLLIATFRDCILGHPVDWLRCSGAAVIALGVFVGGCSYFRWVEHKFADII